MRDAFRHKKPARQKRASTHMAARPIMVDPPLDVPLSSSDSVASGIPEPVVPLSGPISEKPASRRKMLPYTDIDINCWRDYGHIETDSLWLFPGRDRSNGHQLDYHGNCIPQILTQLLSRYTRSGEVILDLFLGSGTSAIEAVNLDRLAIGVELQPTMADYVRDKLTEQGKLAQVEVIVGDSACEASTGPLIARALHRFGRERAQFLFLHPPYGDIIRFSTLERDLSNAASNEAFLDAFEAIACRGYDWLEPGRFAALVIGDKYENGELVPLGFQCMERMNRAGFRTKSIIVKNISGNEKAKGRLSNLWRYRALAGGFYVFKHEYVFLFHKPGQKLREDPSAFL